MAAGADLVTPFEPCRVQQGAYEMLLSDEVVATPSAIGIADPLANNILRVRPGQFALLYTAEVVRIPDDVIAFISIKASIKLHGLVNISGFHVDPGYAGRLKFSVFNAGTETIPLAIGEPTFLIWFADLDHATADPYGTPHRHVGQRGITPEDRVRMEKPATSLPALDQRLKRVEERWNSLVAVVKNLIIPLMVALVAGIVIWLLNTLLPGQPSPVTPASKQALPVGGNTVTPPSNFSPAQPPSSTP